MYDWVGLGVARGLGVGILALCSKWCHPSLLSSSPGPGLGAGLGQCLCLGLGIGGGMGLGLGLGRGPRS